MKRGQGSRYAVEMTKETTQKEKAYACPCQAVSSSFWVLQLLLVAVSPFLSLLNGMQIP